jgi:hypothetical protein
MGQSGAEAPSDKPNANHILIVLAGARPAIGSAHAGALGSNRSTELRSTSPFLVSGGQLLRQSIQSILYPASL